METERQIRELEKAMTTTDNRRLYERCLAVKLVLEGRTMHIVVEEIPGISLFSLNNGSYRISGKKTGLWEASYYISVTNETITRAYSPNAIAITGSFSSTYLGLDSNKQATYYLGWKMGILNYNHYLRATIRNGFLSVTY